MRGLSPRLKLRFLQLYPRFFFMELWPRLIHAAIGRLSLTFFGQSLHFFFFPQTHFEPYHPLKSPITVHLLSHPPSLRSEVVTLAVHLRSKTLASPSISDLNLRLSLHLWSKTLASPSISNLNLRLPLHLRSKTLTSPSISDLNLRLTLHLRSKTLVSPSISDLNRHSPSLQSQPLPHPHPHPPSPISPSPSISDLNLRLTLRLRSPPSPSTSTTTTASRPISGFSFWDFPNRHSPVFLLSPCQFSWHSQRHRRTLWQTVSLFSFFFSLNLYGFMVVFFFFLIKNFWVFVYVEFNNWKLIWFFFLITMMSPCTTDIINYLLNLII